MICYSIFGNRLLRFWSHRFPINDSWFSFLAKISSPLPLQTSDRQIRQCYHLLRITPTPARSGFDRTRRLGRQIRLIRQPEATLHPGLFRQAAPTSPAKATLPAARTIFPVPANARARSRAADTGETASTGMPAFFTCSAVHSGDGARG